MDSEKTEAKQRILDVTIRMLSEQKDTGNITVRQIAKEANANSALINYYFGSKEKLLNKAVEVCMADMANKISFNKLENDSPVERLRNMVKGIASFAVNNYYLSDIIISTELKFGNLSSIQIILPLLREIFEGSKTEDELKLLTLQVITPFQIIFLHAPEYKEYLGKDIFDEKQRNELIDGMVDNIVERRSLE